MRYRDGGQLLVDVLRAAGVDTVFGVISIHNLPLVQAVAAGLRFVPVRHEGAAVNAADGYARARGTLGCAVTSTGTGAGNAAGALIEALTTGSPVLHVTTQIPAPHLGQQRGFIHETKDQLGMLAAVSRQAWSITTPAEAAATLTHAVRAALTPPGGPASVEWPIDLQYAPCEATVGSIGHVGGTTPPAGLTEAAEVLGRSRRPVVWAGGGAAGARDALRDLAERLGAAVFTSNAGRGTISEDHPLCVGNYATTEAGQTLLDEADMLLSVGTHFRSNETANYRMRIPPAHLQIDVAGERIGRVYPVKVGLAGDADITLRALLAHAPEVKTESGWPARVRAARDQARAAHRAAIGPHAELCDALRAALSGTGIIARDITIASSSWGNRLLDIYHPSSNIFARGGGIGQGLAMGIGAALARPADPVAVMVGDGGLAACLGELGTLAEQQPWLVLIVFNDRGYGVLRNLQEARGHARAGVDLYTPRFEYLAAAFELPYACVTQAGQAREALAEALRRRGPALVEVDLGAIGPMPVPFTPPIDGSDADGI